jgi:hypothetical protein
MRLAWIAIVLAGSVFGQSAAEKQRASVALQEASVRKQAESAGIVPLGTRPRNFLAAECDAVCGRSGRAADRWRRESAEVATQAAAGGHRARVGVSTVRGVAGLARRV